MAEEPIPEEVMPDEPMVQEPLAEAPTPTYSVTTQGQQTVYTCLIPDAGSPLGICGHKTRDEGFMTQHMQQQHAGIMIRTDVAPSEAIMPGDPVDTEATSPRTAGRQEAPPHIQEPPPPAPQPLTEAPPQEE